MIKRWIWYVVALVGGILFYCAYQKWFSWFVLMVILFLPVVSLVLSLPAMLLTRIRFSCEERLPMGEKIPVAFTFRNLLPVPETRCALRVTKPLTGESWRLQQGAALPTEHCGLLRCALEKPLIYDYLGLFCLQTPGGAVRNVCVLPPEVEIEDLPSLLQYSGKAWKPKPGGGYSEHHEIREYQPGDKLNQIHWKLTAKTGDLMVREAMEPPEKTIQLEMILRGKPEVLDRKLGQLLWICRYLLSKEIGFKLRILTGAGIFLQEVDSEKTLEQTVEQLLATPCAPPGATMEAAAAAWHYRIGGDGDEA